MRARWQEDEQPAPIDLRLAFAAVAVWAGCLAALWTPAGWWVGAGAAVAAFGVVVLGTVRRRSTPPPWLAPGLVLLACLAVAAVNTQLRIDGATADPLARAAADGRIATATVRVGADPVPVATRFKEWRPDVDAGLWRIRAQSRSVEIDGVRTNSSVSVVIFGTGEAFAAVLPGQELSVRGTVGHDMFADIPGVTLRAHSPPTVLAPPPAWARWAAPLRGALTDVALTLDPEAGGLLRGLVLGDTRGLPERLDADAKTTGLTHLVAVSGTHLGILTGAVVMLLRRAGPRVAAGAGVVAMGLLVILVGPMPSVLRSVTMGAIGAVAVLAGRARASVPALAAAVFLLLLYDPSLATQAGFALSVHATAGLLFLAPGWVAALRRHGVPRGWAAVLVLPVAAHVATVPVIAAISGTVSLVAIPANMLATPVVAPALLLGFVCLLVCAWWPAAGVFLAQVTRPLLAWIASVAHRLADWPHATVAWPASPAGATALALFVVAGLWMLRFGRIRRGVLAAALGVFVAVVGTRVAVTTWPVDRWLLTACDVGQGDAFVVATDRPGVAVVVDAGPDPQAVARCLDALGISMVPLLVLTHLHADHVGGLSGVLEGRQVGMIGVGPDRSSPAAWDELTATAARHAVPVRQLAAGTGGAVDGLDWTVLGPQRPFRGTGADANNDSLVVMARRDGVRMLFTGDIEDEAQRALLRGGADLRADVLKQPHHGSARLLAEFERAVAPTVVIIGVGAENDYGHPSPHALAAARAAGARTVLRTDMHGDAVVCGQRGDLCVATSAGIP